MNASTTFLLRLDEIERVAVATASKLAPWAITLPTAWTIGAAVYDRFTWPLAVAAITGLGVELLGISASATAVEFYAHNQTKRDDDPARPTLLASSMAGLYFVGAVILTAYLENNYVLATFPILSLVGAVTLAIRANHLALVARMQVKIAEENEVKAELKAERKQAREAAKAAKETVQVAVQDAKPIARNYEAYASMQKSRNGRGPMEVSEIMSTFRVSKRTAYNYRERYYEGKKQDETEVEY